jgi:phosphinothricin acetyltransferase
VIAAKNGSRSKKNQRPGRVPGRFIFASMADVMNVSIRPAALSDIPAITRIYGHAVTHGTASFELEAPTEAEMRKRMETLLAGKFPYIVAELDGAVAGYAYAGPYRARPAYRFSVENSIYVAPEMHRRGIGRVLLKALIEASTARGFRLMIAVIGDSAQKASIGIHKAHGFKDAGVFKNVGYKFGRWLDTVHMQLPLGDGPNTPPKD